MSIVKLTFGIVMMISLVALFDDDCFKKLRKHVVKLL